MENRCKIADAIKERLRATYQAQLKGSQINEFTDLFNKTMYEKHPWLNRANARRMTQEGWIVDDYDGVIGPFDRIINQSSWQSRYKSPPFQTDEQALAFVKRRAASGSEFHKNALAVATQIKVKGST